MKTVRIHTDGACSGNQNVENTGGWGAILEYQGTLKELYGGELNTTNNRMELTALLEGLKALKSKDLGVEVFSDSAYIVNCFHQKWYVGWRLNGWRNSQKQPVENRDLWEPILELSESFAQIRYYAVKGHLNLNKDSELKNWYRKFAEKNKTDLDWEAFLQIVRMNHRADELARMGAEAQRRG